MAGSRPVTPASPKAYKRKDPEPGVPLYGCPHLQRLLTKSDEVITNTISRYKILLRVIFDSCPSISQTTQSTDCPPITSLTPKYLCLQCPIITTAKERPNHGRQKYHMLYVDSRSGGLFCQMCGDFVWDPTLEELRVRKIGTGPPTSRKRKRDELFTDSAKDDPKYLSTNTSATPCRANGLRGIYNMGQTCFMSVILQTFIHNPLLRNFYLSCGHQADNCNRRECLSCDMDLLFQDFFGKDKTASYSAFKILSNSWSSQRNNPDNGYNDMAGYRENDAHEYFSFLAGELHRTSQNTRGSNSMHSTDSPCDCIVHQTFYGKFQSDTTCKICESITSKIEPFLELSLGLGSIVKKSDPEEGVGQKVFRPLTLQMCLEEEYMRPESCEYSCDYCGSAQGPATRLTSIKRLPNVLCVQFKRFEHDKDMNKSSKINVQVQFPLQINMLPFTNRARTQSKDAPRNIELARSCTYDLLSVVVHSTKGNNNLGDAHYISYSRVGNQWFMFNDHEVTLASESQVLGAEAFFCFYIIRSLA